jgi:VIT1/CCC1 family predicted Fe2+/Mn2+ transporter
MSMAAGEYVSVGSQADVERAGLAREARELATAFACGAALALLGALGARAGKAQLVPAILRVLLWGARAMATAIIGNLAGAII